MNSRRRWILAVSFSLLLVVAAVTVTPPSSVVHAFAQMSAPTLLAGNEGESGLTGAGRKLFRGWMQHAVSAELAARVDADEDVEALSRVLALSREFVVEPPPDSQVRFGVTHFSAVLAGVGYCDQINGVVAAIAAHRFKRAELFSLYDKALLTSPHTIGRVWSGQRNTWLYFDAFFDEAVIFTRDARGAVHFEDVRGVKPIGARLSCPDRSVYALPGWTLATFHKSFAQTLIARATVRSTANVVADLPTPGVGGGTGRAAAPASAQVATTDVVVERPLIREETTRHATLSRTRNDAILQRVARAYMAARMRHLAGDPSIDAYRAVASDSEAKLDDRAAELASAASRHVRQLRGE